MIHVETSYPSGHTVYRREQPGKFTLDPHESLTDLSKCEWLRVVKVNGAPPHFSWATRDDDLKVDGSVAFDGMTVTNLTSTRQYVVVSTFRGC
jgi:hypothetical protein